MAHGQTSSTGATKASPDQHTTPPASSRGASDVSLDKDKAEFLAYRVARDAEQHILSKAKWLAGLLALVVTVVGLRAWHDYRTAIGSLDERIDKKLETLLDTKYKRIEQIEQRMSDRYVESVISAKQEASKQLEALGTEATSTIEHFKSLAKSASDELERYKRDVERNRLEITAIFERERVGLSDAATPDGARHSSVDVFGPVKGGFLGMLAAGPNSVGADAYIGGEYHGAFHYYFVRNMRKQLDLGLKELSAELAFKAAAQDIKEGSFSQVPLFVGSDWRISVGGLDDTDAKLHALLIGINDYENISDLRGCVNDTKQLEALLKELKRPLETLVVLTDNNAKARSIRESLESLCERSSAGDTIVFSFSGHITHSDKTNGAHSIICPCDVDLENPDTLIELTWVSELIKKAKCKMRVVIAG